MKKQIFDLTNNSTEIVDFNESDLEAFANTQKEIEKQEIEFRQKNENKANAITKLAALGLTEDELKALLGN